MIAFYLPSLLHLLLSFLLLRVVPVQFLFLADAAAFPVAFFLLVRGIVSEWHLASASTPTKKQLPGASHDSQIPIAVSSGRGAIGGGLHKRPSKHDGSTQPGDANALESKATGNGNARIRISMLRKIIMLVINTLVFAMVLDFVYRPLLVPGEKLAIFRPGYVSHNSAKLHIRHPDGGLLDIRYKETMDSENSAAWEVAGPYNAPTNATDFTTTITIGNLKPGARYTAELRNKLPSSPSSAVVLGSVEFKTAPQPNTPTKLRFATGSCIKPNFPYKPTLSPDVYGFASMLGHSHSLDMMLFLGDFIYADLPFYFGPSNEDYRRLYRQVYMADSTRKLVQRVPMLHVYDDHEIKDNWHGQDSPPMGNAMTAYNEYNGDANPDPPLPHRAYYNFTHGNVAFYAWDTRRYRTEWETEDGTNKTMLGIEQKEHFLQWLRDVNHTAAVKFVISSVPVTAAWASVDADHDTWRGYRTERTEILDMTKYVPNLVFLSGDRHEMAAVELSSGNYEFSTSPVSQFTFPALDGFKENIEGERTLHYRRPGHVKYGILDVDTLTNPEVPSISYNLYTTDEHQGKRPAWTFEVKGKPWR